MELIDRIKYLIKLENVSASSFAEKINVQPSSISHILSGRNKPSLEFVQKVLSAYPKVSADWLVSGKTKVVENTIEEEKEIVLDSGGVNSDNPPSTPTSGEHRNIKRIIIFYDDNSFEEVINK